VGNYILLSLDEGGTFAFHVRKVTWAKLGDGNLPFLGGFCSVDFIHSSSSQPGMLTDAQVVVTTCQMKKMEEKTAELQVLANDEKRQIYRKIALVAERPVALYLSRAVSIGIPTLNVFRLTCAGNNRVCQRISPKPVQLDPYNMYHASLDSCPRVAGTCSHPWSES
jgi:hypothetical protein